MRQIGLGTDQNKAVGQASNQIHGEPHPEFEYSFSLNSLPQTIEYSLINLLILMAFLDLHLYIICG